MEMIMISPSQLKVMMDAEDMKKYALNCDDDLRSGSERRLALRTILKKAKEQTGFLSDGRRILVKMFPSRDGGCEMFVTRLGDAARQTEFEETKNAAVIREGMSVYAFETFQGLASACLRLREAGIGGESAAYREIEKSRYYLAVDKSSPLITEMGGSLIRSCAAGYINEYCALICKDAVNVLANYA